LNGTIAYLGGQAYLSDLASPAGQRFYRVLLNR
jgi:hypothetical protein